MVTTHSSPTATLPDSAILASENTMSAPLESCALMLRFTVPAFATWLCSPSGLVLSGRPCRTNPLASLVMVSVATLPSPFSRGEGETVTV